MSQTNKCNPSRMQNPILKTFYSYMKITKEAFEKK